MLEGAPKLVAELPQQVAARAIPALVDIANPICRFLRRACPEIQGDLRLGVDEFAKAEEFICAEVIVLGHAPGKIERADALLNRPDAVPPVIRRRIIAAETDDRASQGTRHRDHLRIHSVDVIARKQQHLIEQHARFLHRGNHEVRGFQPGENARFERELEVIALPLSAIEAHGSASQLLFGMAAAPEAELERGSPTHVSRIYAALIFQNPVHRQLDLLPYAGLNGPGEGHQQHRAIRVCRVAPAWFVSGALPLIERFPWNWQTQFRCAYQIGIGFELTPQMRRAPKVVLEARIFQQLGPQAAVNGVANRLQECPVDRPWNLECRFPACIDT